MTVCVACLKGMVYGLPMYRYICVCDNYIFCTFHLS